MEWEGRGVHGWACRTGGSPGLQITCEHAHVGTLCTREVCAVYM